MNQKRNPGGPAVLQASITKTASFSGAALGRLAGFKELVITLDVTAADRADLNETYDIYVTANDGVSSWDIAHFPQIATTTGAKRYTAKVSGAVLPQTVSSAGAATNDAILKTDTVGADQGIKTLAAGSVRHGAIGDAIGHELVVAGTTPSITYSLTVTGK